LVDRNFLVDQPKDGLFSAFGDARFKIENGQLIESRQMYFAIYQAISGDANTEGLYKKYNADFFDLKNGCFSKMQPPHSLILEQPLTGLWTSILNAKFDDLEELKITSSQRKQLLEKTLEYYSLHVEGFGQVRSHEILEEVLG
jgi:hypothetical protein